MPQEIVKDVGSLNPDFTANGTFRLEVTPPDGVLQSLDFFVRGDHTTNITTAQLDGEVNLIRHLQITINRRGGNPPILINARTRDLKFETLFFEGQLPANANPTATTAIHNGLFKAYLTPPRHILANPLQHGIDTREIRAPIIIEGNYGAITDIGAGATAATQITGVNAVVRKRTRTTPKLVWSINQNRVAHESAARAGPDDLSVGNIEFVYGVLSRNFDTSLPATDRPDGLVTRFTYEHSIGGRLNDELVSVLKRRTNKFFQVPNADVPAGVFFPVFAARGNIGDMLPMSGQTLSVIADSAETQPVDVTNVVPAAGDAIFYNIVGAQLTAAGVEALRARRGR